MSDLTLDVLRADAAGFRGVFAFEEENEHCPDRLVYMSPDFGDEHVISDCIDAHVARPIARVLNSAASALSELRSRRARDLTAEQVGKLRDVRDFIQEQITGGGDTSGEHRLQLSVLDRLLNRGVK